LDHPKIKYVRFIRYNSLGLLCIRPSTNMYSLKMYFCLNELMKKQSTPTSFFCCPRSFYYVSSFCFNY
jgi:hypothetical protein